MSHKEKKNDFVKFIPTRDTPPACLATKLVRMGMNRGRPDGTSGRSACPDYSSGDSVPDEIAGDKILRKTEEKDTAAILRLADDDEHSRTIKPQSFISTWLIVYVLTFFIIVVSLIPLKSPKIIVKSPDKIIHFVMYGILSLMMLRALVIEKIERSRLISFFYAFLLGFFLEVIQIFLPYRSFELWDVLSNFLGSIAGVFIGVRLLVILKGG